MDANAIAYILKREETREQTGFFTAVPHNELPDLPFAEALALLRERPMDDFLHQHLLSRLGKLPPETLKQVLDIPATGEDPVLEALAAEYRLLSKGRDDLEKRLSTKTLHQLSRHTPLIYLRSLMEPDQAVHSRWTALFKRNIEGHEPLPRPSEAGLPLLNFPENPARTRPVVCLADLAGPASDSGKRGDDAFPAGQIADIAESRLDRAGIELGRLMRHEASLSPVGLLRSWKFRTRTRNRRNCFTLSGEQTSYGRGLDLDAARASLMMEIVERYSAFAEISGDGLEHYQRPYPLGYGSYSEMAAAFADAGNAPAVLNPGELALEVSYQNEPLHWVCGESPAPGGGRDRPRPFWVPVQCLFLFCNLDEPALFSGLGSTGLASGRTPAQARLAALLEIIERHQAATVPYDPGTCFRLTARDPKIAGLLAAYQRLGIHLWFQDITPAMGVPCCRCFAADASGTIYSGAAAHLNARRAILAAITETGCPFPHPPAMKPGPETKILVEYEQLPDYSRNTAEADLLLLEDLLIKNGYRPCYVDLTRADVDLPVVKAMIPGMEMMGDFDAFSRVHPELFRNYLNLFK